MHREVNTKSGTKFESWVNTNQALRNQKRKSNEEYIKQISLESTKIANGIGKLK